MKRDTRGKQAAMKKAACSRRCSARYPPISPTRIEATVMAPHCTDWKAPVSPRGLPFSTIRASTSTSVKASPRAMHVKKVAIREYECSPVEPRRRPAAAAVAEVSMR
jgi:hypothetical protein